MTDIHCALLSVLMNWYKIQINQGAPFRKEHTKVKYNYTRKNWDNSEAATKPHPNKRYLRYVLLAVVIIVIAMIAWSLSSSSKHTALGSAHKAPIERPHAKDHHYVTVPLTLPQTSGK